MSKNGMDGYLGITLPFNKFFYELNKDEAEKTFRWFLDVIPQRVDILETNVRKIYSNWIADNSCDSLQDLGSWIKANIIWLERTIDEKKKIIQENNLTGITAQLMNEEEFKISPESSHICFDATIYLGETIRKSVSNVEWHYEKYKRARSYNQPILAVNEDSSMKCIPMDIFGILKSTTAAITIMNRGTDKFVQNYKYWTEKFEACK